MKRTQIKELLMNIKKSFVSFASILVFILLAVSLFLGLSWGGEAVKLSADKTFKDNNFHDFEIVCPYGLPEDQIVQYLDIDGIDSVEGLYKTYELFEHDGTVKQAMVSSITTNIDKLNQIEGRLPSSGTNDEIVIEKYWAKQNDIKLGDVIEFKANNSGKNPHIINAILNIDNTEFNYVDPDGIDNLKLASFTVVGFAESPAYISNNSAVYGSSPDTKCPVDCLMFVNKESFDEKSYIGYSNVLLRSNKLNEYKYFEDDYINGLASLNVKVDGLTSTLTYNRYTLLDSNAQLIRMGYPDLDISVPKYFGTTLDRNKSASISIISLSSDATSNLRYVLSICLYVIALLICFSVISRIVFEQSPFIGTKKALGFSNREITLSYLMYAVIATLLGIILGIAVARFIIEPIVLTAIKSVFVFNTNVMTFSIFESAMISIIAIVFVIAITLISCRKNLKRDALSLLTNTIDEKMKVRRYTKTKLWAKLSLFFKTIVNNFFNEKKRVTATIIGIVGVTTLLVCGFNFVNNVSQSGNTHYKKYQNFDTVVYFKEDSNAKLDIKSILDEEGLESAVVSATSGTITLDNNNSYAVSLFATDDENFSKMYTLTSPKGEVGDINDGFWLCESISANEDVNVGDSITYIDNVLGKKDFKVNGITKYYLLTPSIFMSKSFYKEKFGTEIAYNAYLVISNGKDLTELNERLKTVDGYLLTNNYKEGSISALDNISKSFVYMAILFIVMSFMMALLVIMNLLITFVQTKKKELITLMINGYELNQAKKYIYLDTILLTVIGVIIGLVLGTFIGLVAVNSICSSSIIFPKTIDIIAIVIGVVLTALLMLLISLYALSKIKKFQLTDINS